MVSLLHCCMRTTLETDIVKPRPLRGVTQTPSQLKSPWNVLEIHTRLLLDQQSQQRPTKPNMYETMYCQFTILHQAIEKVFEVHKNLIKMTLLCTVCTNLLGRLTCSTGRRGIHRGLCHGSPRGSPSRFRIRMQWNGSGNITFPHNYVSPFSFFFLN